MNVVYKDNVMECIDRIMSEKCHTRCLLVDVAFVMFGSSGLPRRLYLMMTFWSLMMYEPFFSVFSVFIPLPTSLPSVV